MFWPEGSSAFVCIIVRSKCPGSVPPVWQFDHPLFFTTLDTPLKIPVALASCSHICQIRCPTVSFLSYNEINKTRHSVETHVCRPLTKCFLTSVGITARNYVKPFSTVFILIFVPNSFTKNLLNWYRFTSVDGTRFNAFKKGGRVGG